MRITPEILQALEFCQCKPSATGEPNAHWWHEDLQLEIWEFNGTGEWIWAGSESVAALIRITTVRNLLQLMTWLEGMK